MTKNCKIKIDNFVYKNELSNEAIRALLNKTTNKQELTIICEKFLIPPINDGI